jgi:hypothetical protein
LMNADPKILLYVIIENTRNGTRTWSNVVFQGFIGLLYPRISHLQVFGGYTGFAGRVLLVGRGGRISVSIPHTSFK